MNEIVYIYNKNLELIAQPYVTSYEEFKSNPMIFYPEWKTSFYASRQKYEDPFLDQDSLREKTREEKILLDNKVELLQDGEYIEQDKIIVVPAPETLLKKVWDNQSHTWKEGATDEELKEYYFNRINSYKAEILEIGFDFNGHQQKCREKDLALLGNAIAANEDTTTYSIIPVTHWSFNDGDVVELSLEELKKLRVQGAIFVQAIFTVEAILKASKPNISLAKQIFIEKINEISSVKCYEEVEDV